MLKRVGLLLLLAATVAAGQRSVDDKTNIDRSSQRSWPAGPFSSVNTNHGILQTSIPLISLEGPGDTALSLSLYNRTFQDPNGFPGQLTEHAGLMWQPSFIRSVGPGDGGPQEAVGGNVSRGWNLVINGSQRTYTRKPGVHADLEEIRSGANVVGYVVTDVVGKGKTYYQKDLGGTFRISREADTHGNAVTWRYDGLNRVDRMTDSAGRYIAVSYVDNLYNAQIKDVKLVTPTKTLTWTMNYGPVNNRPYHLYSISLPSTNGSTTPSLIFNYNNQSNLTSTVDARGFMWGYEYAVNGSFETYVKRVYAPKATAYTGYDPAIYSEFSYATQSSPGGTQDEWACTIRDPRGAYWKHVYDNLGTFQGFGSPIRRVHYPVTATDSGDRYQSYAWRYTDATLTSFSNARGYQWNFTYTNDNTGLPLTETDPNGLVTQHRYTNWLETTTINPLGIRTIHRYDPVTFDRLETIVDPQTDPNDGGYSRPAGLALKTTLGYTLTGELERTQVGSSEPTVRSNFDSYGNARSVTSPEGVIVTATYDDRNRKLSETQLAPGGTTTYTYDDWNRLVGTDYPVLAGRPPESISMSYDLNGNVVSTIDARGVARTKSYDQYNRVRFETTPVGGGASAITVETQYEPYGLWKKIVNGRGKTTRYDFDTRGNLTWIVNPLGKTQGYGYDQEGNVVWSQNARNQVTTYAYDPGGRLSFTYEPDGFGYDRRYRNDGLLGAINKRSGSSSTSPLVNQTSWIYDEAGRLTASGQPESGQTVRQSYDDANRPRTLIVNGMIWTFNLFPGKGAQVQKITKNIGYATAASYSYNPNGSFRTAFRLGKLSEFRDYDPQGRAVYMHLSLLGSNNVWTEKLRVEQTLDQAGRITEYRESDEGRLSGSGAQDVVRTYGYDDANRLRSDSAASTLVPGYTDVFNYDANGNRTSVSRNGAVANYPFANDADQIASGEGFTFGLYDNDGLVNSIAVPGGGTYSFVYDHKGRPTVVTLSSGQQVRYTYDALDRLGSRTAGGQTTKYAYGPDGQVIAEIAGDTGQILRYRLAGVTEVEVPRGTSTPADKTSIENLRGDLLATYDLAANRLSRLSYRAYGETQSIQDPLMASGPRRWGGRNGGFTDEVTGLVLFGARWYAPALGRWLTPDPIGQEGGLNLYAYCGNDPVNNVDPSGTEFKGVKGTSNWIEIAYWYLAVAQLRSLKSGQRQAAFIDEPGRDYYIYLKPPKEYTSKAYSTGAWRKKEDSVVGVLINGEELRTSQYVGADPLNPGRSILVPWSPVQVLAHEIGHQIMGRDDRGVSSYKGVAPIRVWGNMINVIFFENPVLQELGKPIRIRY